MRFPILLYAEGKAWYFGAVDTRKRIDAARARLRELQLDERRAEQAGRPCGECLYRRYEPLGRDYIVVCGHLAYTSRRFDPATNRTVEARETPPETARGPDGLCGPEAILFEPKSIPAVIFHRIISTTPGKIAAGLGVGSAFLYLFG